MDCGLVQERPALVSGQSAYCARCNLRLARHYPAGFERSLALSLSALAFLLVASLTPFLDFAFHGRRSTAYLWSGMEMLWETGFQPLSLLVGLTVLFVPFFLVLGLAAVTAPLLIGRCPPYVSLVYRWLRKLRPWAMLEVFLLGVLVAVVKLGDLASISLDVGFYAFVLASLLMLAAWETLDPHGVWDRVGVARIPEEIGTQNADRLAGCPICELRSEIPESAGSDFGCPRCGEPLESRKPHSIQRALALLMAAIVLYLPANLLPVMRIDLLGHSENDTILEGVQALIVGGLWEIAALVFFASFLVPGLKIIGLLYLAWVVRHPSPRRSIFQTRLFRVIDQIGRWSMIDVFMTAVLVGLVQLGSIATILAAPGAICFAAVVVLTIFAARSFDPRALWDAVEEMDG